MKIATSNINNIDRRLPNLLHWLKTSKPDIACLQWLNLFPTPARTRDPAAVQVGGGAC
jgi:exonuclease III